MKRWILLCLALGIGGASLGCNLKPKDDEKSSKAEDEDEDDKKKKKKKSSDDDDDDKSKKSEKQSEKKEKEEGKEAEVDAKKLLEEDDGEGSGVLDVKLPDDDKRDAPSLSGGSAPAAATPGAQLVWMNAGPLLIPNPGWQRVDDGPATLLVAPDKKAGIVFAPFTTPQDGTTKVDKVVALLKMKNPKWKKAKQVTIGPDKVPALFGSGKAVGKDGTPAKLYFALIKTGGPQNLLAIGIADHDAPEPTLKMGLDIVGSIKKKR
jgi:hypothetical protein